MSERLQTGDVYDFTRSYTAFLSLWFNNLLRMAIFAEPIEFWEVVKKFVVFLPREVKERIKPLIEKVDKEVRKIIEGTRAPSMILTNLRRRRRVNRYLKTASLQVLDYVLNELDKRGYLEKRSKPIPVGGEW